jgi:hypothetical protein
MTAAQRLSVRVDGGLAADLAVMARAGLSASDAVRIALSVVAGAYEAAWASGAVPDGVQPEITGCTGLRMTPAAERMTQVRPRTLTGESVERG